MKNSNFFLIISKESIKLIFFRNLRALEIFLFIKQILFYKFLDYAFYIDIQLKILFKKKR